MNKHREIVLWRRVCRALFRHTPTLGAAVLCAYMGHLWAGGEEIPSIQASLTIGAIPFLVMLAASHAFGFCHIHRMLITYCFAISVALSHECAKPVYIVGTLAGAAILIDVLIRLYIHYAKRHKQSSCAHPSCSSRTA